MVILQKRSKPSAGAPRAQPVCQRCTSCMRARSARNRPPFTFESAVQSFRQQQARRGLSHEPCSDLPAPCEPARPCSCTTVPCANSHKASGLGAGSPGADPHERALPGAPASFGCLRHTLAARHAMECAMVPPVRRYPQGTGAGKPNPPSPPLPLPLAAAWAPTAASRRQMSQRRWAWRSRPGSGQSGSRRSQ